MLTDNLHETLSRLATLVLAVAMSTAVRCGYGPSRLLRDTAIRPEQMDNAAIHELTQKGWPVFLTSARTGAGVEDAFVLLTKRMLET